MTDDDGEYFDPTGSQHSYVELYDESDDKFVEFQLKEDEETALTASDMLSTNLVGGL